jgi:UDP-2,3-diacylglucosamine pyrophosphatase LpxH
MSEVRSIFISDIHLGTRACQAERLLAFLKAYDAENIFLLGDIVDFWAMSRGVYWSEAQNTVVQKLLKRARHDINILFVPGYHDEAARNYIGTFFGDIQVVDEYVHTTFDGKRYLLMHGDKFDQVTRHHRWVALLGDMAYDTLVYINAQLSWLRRALRVSGYWSLAGYAKRKVKRAIEFVYGFEESVVRYVKQRGLDGVVCGHIHWAAEKTIDGVVYLNCGDWVDSCTAVVEHKDGRMQVVRWGSPANDLDNTTEPEKDGVVPATTKIIAAPASNQRKIAER